MADGPMPGLHLFDLGCVNTGFAALIDATSLGTCYSFKLAFSAQVGFKF